MKIKKHFLFVLFFTVFISISLFAQGEKTSKVTIEDPVVNQEFEKNDARYKELDKQFKELMASFRKFYSNIKKTGFSRVSGDFSKDNLIDFVQKAETHKSNIKNNAQVSSLNNQLNNLAKLTSRGKQDRIEYFKNSLLPSVESDITSAKDLINEINKNESKKELSVGFGNSSRSIKTYKQNYEPTDAHIKSEIYLNQQSADFVAKVDAASNGNHLFAASQKFGYALGNALGGRIDVNSIAGTAVSVIKFLGENKRKKEALEAQKRAIKKKIEEENRLRELARIKFVNGLKRERNNVYRDLPAYSYPNYLTDSDKTSYYYFVIYTNDNILTTDYPKADITDIIEVKKYKDGTWPFESDFKTDIQKLSSKPISKIIGYTNYEIASLKLASMITGFGKGGVNLQFIKANKNKISEDTKYTATNKQDPKDFWGKKISLNKNTKILKKTTKTSKTSTKTSKTTPKKDFWGKSIQLKKQKDTLTKKKDL